MLRSKLLSRPSPHVRTRRVNILTCRAKLFTDHFDMDSGQAIFSPWNLARPSPLACSSQHTGHASLPPAGRSLRQPRSLRHVRGWLRRRPSQRVHINAAQFILIISPSTCRGRAHVAASISACAAPRGARHTRHDRCGGREDFSAPRAPTVNWARARPGAPRYLWCLPAHHLAVLKAETQGRARAQLPAFTWVGD